MCDFEVYRAQIPAPFGRDEIGPVISHCYALNVCVQALAQLDAQFPSAGYSPSDYVEERTVTIWYFNRQGWVLAHRLIRRLAQQTVSFSELVAMNRATGNLIVIPHHFRSDQMRETA